MLHFVNSISDQTIIFIVPSELYEHKHSKMREGERERKREREREREADRQADRKTDRQTEMRQTATDREKE